MALKSLNPRSNKQTDFMDVPLKAVSGSKQKAAKTTGKLLKASLDSLLLGHTSKKYRGGIKLSTFHCKYYMLSQYRLSIVNCTFDSIWVSENVVSHSAIKGHVPNQSLYTGWEQSFPCFHSWSEKGHYFLSRWSIDKMQKWNIFHLG